jgi:hypothetical protein
MHKDRGQIWISDTKARSPNCSYYCCLRTTRVFSFRAHFCESVILCIFIYAYFLPSLATSYSPHLDCRSPQNRPRAWFRDAEDVHQDFGCSLKLPLPPFIDELIKRSIFSPVDVVPTFHLSSFVPSKSPNPGMATHSHLPYPLYEFLYHRRTRSHFVTRSNGFSPCMRFPTPQSFTICVILAWPYRDSMPSRFTPPHRLRSSLGILLPFIGDFDARPKVIETRPDWAQLRVGPLSQEGFFMPNNEGQIVTEENCSTVFSQVQYLHGLFIFV